MIEFQLLVGLRGVEKSILNDNNLFPFTVVVGIVGGSKKRQNNLIDRWDVLGMHIWIRARASRPGKHRVAIGHIQSSVLASFVFGPDLFRKR